jgi:ankyrin repeat protein
MVFFAAL